MKKNYIQLRTHASVKENMVRNISTYTYAHSAWDQPNILGTLTPRTTQFHAMGAGTACILPPAL